MKKHWSTLLPVLLILLLLTVATLPILKTKAETQTPTIQDPTPGYWETSEYMTGKVAVGIILPESNGTIDPNTEDWTDAEIQKVLSEIQTALDWRASQNPNASVSFVTEVHARVPTSYEPISHTESEFLSLVIPEVMRDLGYVNTIRQYQLRDCANDLRGKLKADWAFTIFVVDSSNDSDGMFKEGGTAATMSMLYLYMTYDNGKNIPPPWEGDNEGIENMDRVCAHEIGHIFYAADEYIGIPSWGGYLNVSSIPHSGCLMDNESWKLSGAPHGLNGTWGQVGWRDSDGDGIQDIVDTSQQVSLNSPTRIGTTFNFTGVATVTPYPNRNSFTNNPQGRRDVTVNIITNVTYRVDNGTWSNATMTPTTIRKLQKYPDTCIDKETFAIVNFTFLTSELNPGQHLVEAKATNQWNISGYANQTVTIPKSNFSFNPSTSKVNQNILFNASASQGIIVSYAWDFGDGNRTSTSQPLITHVYTNVGNYSVILNVTDSNGMWDTTQKQVQVVQPHGPEAKFHASPETANVGQPITFDASNSQPGWNGTNQMPITKYSWNFADGNKTDTASPTITHAYTNAGNYTVTLNVTDNQGLWNTTSALVNVTGIPTIHDVAITSINPYQTKVSNRTTTSINVTATNQGDTAETFNVTLTYNSTVIRTEVVTLNVQNSTTITFVWNTTGVPLGNYTVTATASQAPGETDTTDNSLSSTIQVSILGDINGDGRVDMKDVSKVAAGFQTHPGDTKWVSNGDIDENKVIDMKDISSIAKHFGEHYP